MANQTVTKLIGRVESDLPFPILSDAVMRSWHSVHVYTDPAMTLSSLVGRPKSVALVDSIDDGRGPYFELVCTLTPDLSATKRLLRFAMQVPHTRFVFHPVFVITRAGPVPWFSRFSSFLFGTALPPPPPKKATLTGWWVEPGQ